MIREAGQQTSCPVPTAPPGGSRKEQDDSINKQKGALKFRMPAYNLGRCLSPADTFHWKQKCSPASDPTCSLATPDFSASNSTQLWEAGGGGRGASRAIVQSPTAGPVSSALFPPAPEVAMVSSALLIIKVAATLELTFLLGKVTRLMSPTISPCPGELQRKVAMNRKKNTTPMITGGNTQLHRFVCKK